MTPKRQTFGEVGSDAARVQVCEIEHLLYLVAQPGETRCVDEWERLSADDAHHTISANSRPDQAANHDRVLVNNNVRSLARMEPSKGCKAHGDYLYDVTNSTTCTSSISPAVRPPWERISPYGAFVPAAMAAYLNAMAFCCAARTMRRASGRSGPSWT